LTEPNADELAENFTGSSGRGFRDRKSVSYDDGLSELQWAKIIEESANPEGDLEKARNRKRRKNNPEGKGEDSDDIEYQRDKKKSKKSGHSSSSDSEEEKPKKKKSINENTNGSGSASTNGGKEKDDSEGSKEKSARGRGRGRGRAVQTDTSPDSPKRRPPGRGKKRSTKNEEVSSDNDEDHHNTTNNEIRNDPIKSKLEAIWNCLRNETEPETGRVMSRLFTKLPSKKEYPDYYSVISNPIDMNKIHHKLLSDSTLNNEKDSKKNKSEGEVSSGMNKGYSPSQFLHDFMLLFNNAQEYNIPGSEVYKDAVHLQAFFKSEFLKEFPEEYHKYMSANNKKRVNVEDNKEEDEPKIMANSEGAVPLRFQKKKSTTLAMIQ